MSLAASTGTFMLSLPAVNATNQTEALALYARPILLIIGTVIDGIPGLIMTVPILLPVATDVYHIDPRQFGVVVVINLVLGLLSPPVGLCFTATFPPDRAAEATSFLQDRDAMLVVAM